MEDVVAFVQEAEQQLAVLKADEGLTVAQLESWPKQRLDVLRVAAGHFQELSYLHAKYQKWMLQQVCHTCFICYQSRHTTLLQGTSPLSQSASPSIYTDNMFELIWRTTPTECCQALQSYCLLKLEFEGGLCCRAHAFRRQLALKSSLILPEPELSGWQAGKKLQNGAL